ncbi:hypothetical protein EJ07DRAFT_150980 [Lizonia empirigonia]|nr:hypothetical protein EJ07DRAFT_150980 [Lizonia empirigonia]
MAPTLFESTAARPRRPLYPNYCIDAPHLLALRNVLSTAIVPPKKPLRLMRTRPDKRIGQIEPAYDVTRRCQHGVNGPPGSANKSFYFHHEDPDFKKLLPQVDRSRYEWADHPASEGSQDSKDTTDLEIFNSTPKRTASSRSSGSITTPRSTDSKEAAAPGSPNSSKESFPDMATEQKDGTRKSDGLPLEYKVVQEQRTAISQTPQSASAPMIPSTSAGCLKSVTTGYRDHAPTSTLLLRTTGKQIDLPDAQETQDTACPSSIPTTYTTCLPDTQDTSASSQSNIFSPPVSFLQFTPPTQEGTQDVDSSQVSNASTETFTDPEETKNKPIQWYSCFPASSPVSSSLPAPSQGKRPRETSDEDSAPPQKRPKSPI